MERLFAAGGGTEKGRSPLAPQAMPAPLSVPPGAAFDSASRRKQEIVRATDLIPVAEGELAVIETYLGQALDELLGSLNSFNG